MRWDEYTSYGCTKTLGNATYGVTGYPSAEEAEVAVHMLAYRDGNYHIPKLRDRWWQFWRPDVHSELDLRIIAHNEDLERHG